DIRAFEELADETTKLLLEIDENREKIDKLEIKELELEDTIQHIRDERDDAIRLKRDAERASIDLQKKLAQTCDIESITLRFGKLPENSAEALDLILSMFPARIAATDRARKTA